MDIDDLMEFCQSLLSLKRSSDEKDAEISFWRERYLREKPKLNPRKDSFIWNCFLSTPSRDMLSCGVDENYSKILKSIINENQ